MTEIHFYQGLQNLIQSEDSSNIEKVIENIKAKIAEFFNMRNIHFLFGSGTSADAIPIMSGLYENVHENLKKYEKSIRDEFDGIFKGIDSKKNLEEILGVLYSNRIYLEVIKPENDCLSDCNKLIKVIEETIFEKINVDFTSDKSREVLKTYKSFYQKVALRNKDLARLNIFTTNNDLFNEVALDSLNINFINGFSGGLNRFFNPAFFNYTFSKRMDTSIEKFEPVENMIYLYKLHGSVNWIEDSNNSNTFFKIKEIPVPNFSNNNVLIYPTPTKQNKSLGSPYVETFREFQKKLLEPNSVLFVIGYSFSDEHVNNIIYQALATNSTINVVIINNIEDKSISEIDDSRIFRIFGKHGDKTVHYFKYIVDNLLPDVNTFKGNDNALESFLKEYNDKLKK